jgi:subtilisin family serine protease
MRPAWTWGDLPPEELRLPRSPLLDAISWEAAFGGGAGRGARVAVIDSGIDGDHPAIGGMVRGWAEPVMDEHGAISYREEPHGDLFGHGTACAGIIHAIAPEAELYSIRVLGRRLSGKGAIFAAGLRWAIDHGMHVVNLSLGTTNRDHFSLFHELVDEAYYRRVVLVSAANNMPVISYPSLYSTVVSVACCELEADAGPFAYYGNPSPPVEFGAAGIDVRLAWLNGGYITATGNSFAAPRLTGLVALLLAKHPDLTPFQVKTVLRALARNAQPAERPS